MHYRIAEPAGVTEIVGGRYDGDFRVEANCPGCGNPVTHILDAATFSSHRAADCGSRCAGGYDVVRPLANLFGLPHRWWDEPFQFLRITNLGLGIETEIDGAGDVPGLLGEVA